MRIIKLFFAIAVGIMSVWGFVCGVAQASSQMVSPQAPRATILYVDAEAPGPTHDGASWATAYTTVQDALTIAISSTEIWVAEGIYYPDEGIGQIDNFISSTFTLTDGVALYGGFDPGSGMDEFSERDWETYVTVLSGDIDKNDTTDPHGVVSTTTHINGSNAHHVVSSKGVTQAAILDGFTITAGYTGENVYLPDPSGGGMANEESNPRLSNMIFSGNFAFAYGGGLMNYESNPTLNNVSFFGNSSGVGGGMANLDSSNPILNNVIFSRNLATFTGGMANYESNPILNNVTFSGNRAERDSGGMYNYLSNPTLTNVTFSGNFAGSNGGGMYNKYFSDATLINVTFSNNSAGNNGGGMANADSNLTLTNVVFSSNSAGRNGGGMYNGIRSNLALTNLTFSGNTADYGGGIFNTAVSTPTLTNTILWGNTSPISGPQIHNETDSTVLISYSDVQGCGESGAGWDLACGTDNGNNIDADPLFLRNPHPGPDGIWDDIDNDFGDLHLRAGSPASDTGTNSVCPPTDLDGTLRPVNTICDMGAYEYLNLPPVAVDDGGWGFATDKELPFTTVSVLANDWDPNDDPITITNVDTSGVLGLITNNGDGSFAYNPYGQFDYLAPGESATEVFTYTVSDGLGGSDTATVTLTIVDYFYLYLPLIGK